MREDLTRTAATAVELARKAGAADAWASASQGRNVEISYRDDKVEKAQEATSRSLSLRLYVDGRYSAHTTTDLRADRLASFVAEAVAMTRALEPDEHRKITDPTLFRDLPAVDLDLVDGGQEEQDNGRRVALCTAMAETARANDKVISVTAWSSDGNDVSAAVSSNGFSGFREATYFWVGADVTVKGDGDKRPEDGSWAGGCHAGKLPDPGEIGRDALRRAVAQLGSVKGPTAKTTMVVEPRAAGRLLRMLLGPADGQSLQQQRSFWAERQQGRAVAELLTIVDEPLLPRGVASRQFDGEGIAARRLPIIENGTLRNFYVDTYYGSKLGMAPTTGSSSNQLVTLGERALSELVKQAKDGIYISSWLGGNSNGTTGDFSLGCRGHRIAGGEIGAPVGEMNVTGNLVDLFSHLVAVGNDPWVYSSIQAPTLVFEGVQFSGA